MDKILDLLSDQGWVEKVPLTRPSPVSSPAFIIWNKLKPHMVLDLWRVNKKLIPNAYPLPQQNDILGTMEGATVFSLFDVIKGFFQQRIWSKDRWKTTFSTPHQGHEQLTVVLMGLTSSPGFFQACMEQLLSKYLWKFLCIYINNIIIFSWNTDNHLVHLDEVLTLLEESGISLAISKCYFAYCSVQMLGHHVSWLGVSIAADKVVTVQNMCFPANLWSLEAGV